MSEKETVVEAPMTNDQLRQYIDQQFMQLAEGVRQVMSYQMSEVMQRIIGIESVLSDKVKGINKNTFVNKLAELQDESSGFAEVDTVEVGDRVRFTLKTQKLPSRSVETTRHLIDNVGSGNTMGDWEKHLVGLKTLQTKTVLAGEGEEQYKLTFEVNRVSREKRADVHNIQEYRGEVNATQE